MADLSLRHHPKLISYLFTFLLIWQLCSEFRSVSQYLPDTEVRALRAITSMSESEFYVSESFCLGNTVFTGSSYIYCDSDCAPKSGNTCHVITIVLPNQGLTGVIPEVVGDLLHLVTLDLSNNKLTGSLPASLGNLSRLSRFSAHHNFLTGPIPSSLGALSSLRILDLSYNLLTDKIPGELGKLTQLRYLYLGENQLSGALPSELGSLGKIEYMWLPSNKLTGKLPETFANLKNLVNFQVMGNSLSGMIPEYFANWPNLRVLTLLGNSFTGHLPPYIFKLSSLRYLWVSDLNNSGFPFPDSADLPNLLSLVIRHCSITGQIPAYIGDMSSLDHLDLSFNKLSGEIPSSIRKMNLTTKYLAGNEFPDSTIPDWLPDVTSPLEKLQEYCPGKKPKYHSLFINCGGGQTISEENHYDEDNKTESFYLSPKRNWAYSCSEESQSTNASSHDYVKNATCGITDSDATLYASARFCPLSLKYHGFCLQEGNYTVRLHFAEIVFADKKDYSSLLDRVFDVYIQGERVLKDFNIKEIKGGANRALNESFNVTVKEDHLLNIHLYWAGKGTIGGNGPLISAISVTPDFPVGGDELSPLHITLIAVASAIFTLLLLLILSWNMGWLGHKKEPEKVDIKFPDGPVSVPLKQVIDATDNFSREIGRGEFGIVYKAKLRNQIVAVKKLSAQSKQAMDEFTNEIDRLSSLKHENLVKLLGGYSAKDLHFLIYEYMEHNSIAKALFATENEGRPRGQVTRFYCCGNKHKFPDSKDSTSNINLNWEKRSEICLGIAKGLEFLHEKHKIVHRDIKASNILLDGNLKARISDFGLARLCNEDDQNMISRVAGTRGYMAPEYVMRGIFTEKADVYSFGIVLLEIISGKNNAENNPTEKSEFLLNKACVLHQRGRLVDLVDKNMPLYNPEQVKTILNLAMRCTSLSPPLRPEMSAVVNVLQGNKTIEQISAGHSTASTSSTEFSHTSLELTSNATSYFIIKERDEMKHVSTDSSLDISNESNISSIKCPN